MISAARPGFALFTVLIAILLLTALSTATLFRASTDASIAYSTTLRQHAFFAAERTLWSSLTRPYPFTTMTTITTPTQTTRLTVTQTAPTLYWIVAHATVRRGPHEATHRLALSARLVTTDSTATLTPIPPYAWADLPL